MQGFRVASTLNLALTLLIPHVVLAGGSVVLDGAAEKIDWGGEDLRAIDIVSRSGVEILAGVIETFLHRGNLSQEEMNCMVTNVKNGTHIVYNDARKVADSFNAIANPDATSDDAFTGVGELVLLIPKLEHGLDSIVDIVNGFTQRCLGSSVAPELELAAVHLSNLTYVAGHLNANGADIVREISRAAKAFQAADYRGFGRQIGQACRKILLSKSSVPSFPEFLPSLHQMVNMSAGIAHGFFGPGFALDITSDKKIVTMSVEEASGWDWDADETDSAQTTSAPEGKMLKLHVDLHRCVKRNQKFFESVMYGALYFFAQQDVQSDDEADTVLQFPVFLSTALESVPSALSKCGTDDEHQQLLMASMQAMDHVHSKFTVPEAADSANYDAVVHDLEKAADAWKELDWFSLGDNLGKMLLEMTLQSYPQLYDLDSTGKLRQRPRGSSLTTALHFLAVPMLAVAVAAVVRGVAASKRRQAHAIADGTLLE